MTPQSPPTTRTAAAGARAGAPAGGRAAARATRRRARLQPALSAGLLLLRRGLRRDGLLLAAWGVVVGLAVVVAVGGPRLTTDVLDAAAQAAVRDAGRDADLVVGLRTTSPADVLEYRDEAVGDVRLPSLRGTLGGAVATFSTANVGLQAIDEVVLAEAALFAELLEAGLAGEALEAAVEAALADAQARFALVPSRPEVRAVLLEDPSSVRVVDGDPGAPPVAEGARPVALPEATAAAWGLGVGDVLTLSGPATGGRDALGSLQEPLDVEVTAVVAPVDPDDLLWRDAWPVWERPAAREAQVLASPELAEELRATLGATVHGVVRLVVDPDRFSGASAAEVAEELTELETGTGAVVPSGAARLAYVETELPEVLAEHLVEVRAAVAQMSVPVAGAVGVVAVVLLLAARLVVGRRRAVLELERARGAAVGVVVARLAAESVLVTGVAVAAALGLLALVLPGPTAAVPLATVVATALVATPLWSARVARRAWSGSREPANRRDRDRLARRRAAARLVVEGAVLVLAVGAAAAMRGRGLLQTTTRSADPFLAAAPLLIALAVTAVALRLYPWVVRALAALARRSPGVLGVVGAARARRAVAPLPLLALTLAASVGATGLLLVATVRSGQTDASWARVGADARVVVTEVGGGADLADAVERLVGDPGVTAASAAYVREEVPADLGNRNRTVSVVAVDAGFRALLTEVPGSGRDLAAFDILADHEPGPDGATIPAVVDRRLAPSIGERGITMTVERRRVALEVVGVTDHAPRGVAPGPFVYLPLDALRDADDAPVRATVAWVQGPGAGAAAAEAASAVGLPPEAVTTRVEWLSGRRSTALVGGVEEVLLLGGLVAVALAAVGMVATVLAGSRDRGRALALLRTLGMRPGLGWWFVLVELAPVVLAAALAGTAAGAVVVGVLGSALGMDVLAGGPDVPPVVVDLAVPVWLTVGAVGLLVVAAALEVAAHRRDRLSDVVRVGETPGG